MCDRSTRHALSDHALISEGSLTFGPAWRSKRAGEPVAQLVEHETFNLGVVGSNPTGLTKLHRIRLSSNPCSGTGHIGGSSSRRSTWGGAWRGRHPNRALRAGLSRAGAANAQPGSCACRTSS